MKTRNFILSMIALCCMTMAQAQKTDVMTATLQHGDDVTVFTTQTAFANAYAAAVDGDVITLSPGTFNATNLTKSVNIYGSGFEENETDGTSITQINGDLSIGVTDETLSNVHIEGVFFYDYFRNYASSPLTNITIKKCSFRNNISIQSEITNVTFCDCVMGTITGVYNIMANNLLITNCHFGIITTFQPGSTVLIDHSIVTGCTSHYQGGSISPTHALNVSQFTWKNCCFTSQNTDYGYWQRVGRGSLLYNCLYYKYIGGTDIANLHDCTLVSDNAMFSDANNANYSAERTFTLQQPTVWIGDDDTEIGIRGGLYPWNKVPATPVVKSLQLDVDGTNLNVTFDAETR